MNSAIRIRISFIVSKTHLCFLLKSGSGSESTLLLFFVVFEPHVVDHQGGSKKKSSNFLGRKLSWEGADKVISIRNHGLNATFSSFFKNTNKLTTLVHVESHGLTIFTGASWTTNTTLHAVSLNMENHVSHCIFNFELSIAALARKSDFSK